MLPNHRRRKPTIIRGLHAVWSKKISVVEITKKNARNLSSSSRPFENVHSDDEMCTNNIIGILALGGTAFAASPRLWRDKTTAGTPQCCQ